MLRRILAAFAAFAVVLGSCVFAYAESAGRGEGGEAEGKHLRILFTSDIHDYYMSASAAVEDEVEERGGAARLATLLERFRDEATVVLDCGDFSMGTLLGAGYSSDAYELRILGALGFDCTTLGNHEWDFGPEGLDAMLGAAKASGDELPVLVSSNIDFEGELSEAQSMIKERFEGGSICKSAILEAGGLRIGVFGVMGYDAVECAPTSGQKWTDYKEAAALMVEELEGVTDVIVCLSHSGMSDSGEGGEDMELVKAVPGIDVVISGHTHTVLEEAVAEGGSIIGSCGEYLSYLGVMDISVADGSVSLEDYRLVPLDESVPEDPATAAMVEGFKEEISGSYLAEHGYGFDDPIAVSGFNTSTLSEMYGTHQEYTTGNLIADSYIYEAKKHGINDIDVALVGLGTIRGSVCKGEISAADAFEICSLGVGSDGSAGHPLVCAYIDGRELKLLTELDASLGPAVSSIKMSYSGLNYRFNTKRMLLDRVTSVGLSRSGGMMELIEDDMLYKVCCNMYAANMLGMLNGLTKGLLSITPKHADGSPVEDFYDCVMTDADGREIKEWVAFADYLSSFRRGESGLPEIPENYMQPQGRKVKYEEGGLAVISNPGAPTLIAIAAVALLILLVALAALLIRRLMRSAACRRKGGGSRKDALKG